MKGDMMVIMTNAEQKNNDAFDVAQVRRKHAGKRRWMLMLMSDVLLLVHAIREEEKGGAKG